MNKKKILLIVFVLIILISNYYIKSTNIFTLENLKMNRDIMLNYVNNNFIKSILLFAVVYILTVSLSIPGAAILSLSGGLLFSVKYGFLVVLLSAVIGSLINLIASRFLFRDFIKSKFKTRMDKINKDLEEHGTNYLLTLRLIPIFPFFLINLAVGVSDISLRKFLLTSFFGMAPGTLAYVYAGSNLATVNDLNDIIAPEVLAGFIILGLFALIPSIYKKVKLKDQKTSN